MTPLLLLWLACHPAAGEADDDRCCMSGTVRAAGTADP